MRRNDLKGGTLFWVACNLILAALLLTPAAVAQPPAGARLRGEAEAAQTRKRIAEAQQKIAAGQAAEAADALQRILEESGDDLVLVKDGTYQPARRLVQMTMAALPAEARATFAARLDAPAKALLERGERDRDPRPLRELRDRYFIARPTEKALALLGELHFERGEFFEAERCWRTLLPPSDPADLTYPAPTGDPATYRAKAILAAVAAGDRGRAAADLAGFATEFPKAAGRLASTEGVYAETLAKVVREGMFPPPAAESLPRFPTLRPAWKTPIPPDPADRGGLHPAFIPPARSLVFHPVIAGGFAYVADAARILAFDLKDGTSQVAFDCRRGKNAVAVGVDDMTLPNETGAAFTLTAADGRLYARLGPTAISNPGSVLVAFDIRPGGKLQKAWSLSAGAKGVWDDTALAAVCGSPALAYPAKPGCAWLGSPVVEDSVLYAAYARIDERGRFVQSVASYRDGTEPRRLWNVDVSEADAPPAGPPYRLERVTLAGMQVVFATHTGVTVALDRATGRAAWAFRNPPVAKPSTFAREGGPAVCAMGKVFVAPTDADRLFALDAETGCLAWDSPAIGIQHLLGVASGKLVAIVSGPQKGIRAFNLADGSTQGPGGWQNHDDPSLATYGRGLVAGNAIYWPTTEKLYRLDPASGSVQPTLPKPGPHGNLAFGSGMLVVATPTEVWGYASVPGPPEPPPSVEPPRLNPISLPAGSAAEFDPTAATTVRLPVKPIRSEAIPPADPPHGGVVVGALRVGFVGSHHLAGVDAATGRIVWSLDALGRPRPPAVAVESSPTFAPHLLAVDSSVWVQTSDSQRWLVDAKTGEVQHRQATADTPWVASPVPLGSSRTAFPDGPGTVRAFDSIYRQIWTYDAGREASLSGVPPAACRFGNALFVATHRNYGVEVMRVDPQFGRALWRRPVVVAGGPFDWRGAAADGSRLFLPDGDGLLALDLATGREAWRAKWPGTGDGTPYRCVRGRHVLFAVAAAMPVEPFTDALDRLARRFLERPRMDRAIGIAFTLAEVAGSWKLPVAAFDPASGQPEGFQILPCGPGATAAFEGGRLAVRSPAAVSWWAATP